MTFEQPTIIKPFFGDQAFWAERVESLNVGSAVRKLTSENLAEALKKATTDEKQIAKAKIVGQMIRTVGLPIHVHECAPDAKQENGVSRAVEAIYRDLVGLLRLLHFFSGADRSRRNTRNL